MSLIDFRHFTAPFKNTVHLVTIIFVVMLFAVYRLATGGVDVVDRTSIPQQYQQQPQHPQQNAQPAAPAVQLPSSSLGQGNDIQKLLAGNGNGQQKAAPANNPALTGAPTQGAPGGQPADLQDIERALGINK